MSPLDHKLQGKAYWRSLEDWADSPAFRAFVENEFPAHADALTRGPTRRALLKVMGASLAMAGLTGCRRWPEDKLAPYAHRPEGGTPGLSQQYATAMEIGGVAIGLLVTSFDGRPVKIEGNPSHPASGGAAHAFAQASVLELYDPDRSRFPLERIREAVEGAGGQREARTWDDFENFSRGQLTGLKAEGGTGLAVLSEASSSPTMAAMRAKFAAAFPGAQWYEYEAISRDNERDGAFWAWGRAVRPQLHLDQAEVIVCLDADILGSHPNSLAYARDWATGRRTADAGRMNRLYMIETSYSITGGVADHRLAARASRIPGIAHAIAVQVEAYKADPLAMEDRQQTFVDHLVADLKTHAGRCVVVAGRTQPRETHVLCHRINEVLGDIGRTISYTLDAEGEPPLHLDAIKALSAGMADGRIQTLLILGGNPAYDAPADCHFAALLAKVPNAVHLSLYDNETSRLCRWHLPRAHYLESWGDARSWDGTLGIIQPLIEPLYAGRSSIELLAALLNEPVREGYELVRQVWRGLLPADDFEKAWREVLHDGLLANSAFPAVPDLKRRAGSQGLLAHAFDSSATAPRENVGREVSFAESRATYDGRFANNGWLQELPDPMTRLTWDNAALISPFDANMMSLRTGDVILLEATESAAHRQSIELPVYVLPGQAEGTITLPLGYGRTAAGRVGDGVGVHTGMLRVSTAMDHRVDVTVQPTGRSYPLACTQDHHAIDPVGFEARRQRAGQLIREATLKNYSGQPRFAQEQSHTPQSLQLWAEPQEYPDHKWGMAIDLNCCIGCNACVVACQAENNIPVVGKEQVSMGRAMHWIRVDRYFSGDPLEPSPQVAHQPMACHHCENAPCEQVCPVAATVHDSEGLNVMVYNRCVGTRYCSNNCPYKVRRFNYFDYHSLEPHDTRVPWLGMPDSQQQAEVDAVKRMVYNPDVTVRMRGVMEKCTFCTQRIQGAKMHARREGRTLADGEITPACAQTCPTQAIVFGDLNDPNSRVRQLHEHHRAYGVLEELNVKPRTKYLARIRNPGGEAGG